MTIREIIQLVQAHGVTEGAGVRVRRSIGIPARRHLDPFLMLDHFSSNDPSDYLGGFPPHPHRGFITLTYMLQGHMLHQDSMGHRGELRSGGAQWMKAASGIIHSEMPQQKEGLMEGFQLWINLPAREKMSAPAYQEFTAEAIPEVNHKGAQVRLLSGEYGGHQGPIHDSHTHVHYLDIRLDPEQAFTHLLASDLAGFLYVFAGQITAAGKRVPRQHLAVLGQGERIEVIAGSQGARFILVAGRPLGEPIVQSGPFVMASREEVEQAHADYRAGRLVQGKAEILGA